MLTSVLAIVTVSVTLVTASIKEAKFVKQVSATYNPILQDRAFAFDCISKCGRSIQCAATNVLFELRTCTYLTEVQLEELASFDDLLYKKTHPPPPTCQNGGFWADSSKTYCTCSGSFTGTYCERYWEDCSEGHALGSTTDGVYTIQPRLSPVSFETYCQMRWGGRTYIQRQVDGIDFYRNWQEYRDGFGDVRSDDYWLGLERIESLCASNSCRLTIRVDYKTDPYWRNTHYWNFTLTNEDDGYRMNFTEISVTDDIERQLSDGLTELKGAKFSTYDRDNDDKPDGSCAETHHSGWWFKNCTPSNLNGKLKPVPTQITGEPTVVFWAGDTRGITKTRIGVRTHSAHW